MGNLSAVLIACFSSSLWQLLKSRFPKIDSLDFGNWGGVGVIVAVSVTTWNTYLPAQWRVLPQAGIEAQVVYVLGLGVMLHAGKKIAESKLARKGEIDRRQGESLMTWVLKALRQAGGSG